MKYKLILKDSGKIKKMSEEKRKFFKEHGYLDYCKIVTIDLNKLIKSYHLDTNKDHGMFSRRSERWGNYDNFASYEDAKDDNWNSPIIVHSGGAVQDGLHRLYALWRDGYDYAEVLQTRPYDFKNKKYLDDDYDYGTGEVKGKDIFDITTTGCTGTWQDLLKGIDTDYYKNKKNLKGKIVQMSPNEYYRECARMFNSRRQSTNTNPERLKQQRRIDNGEDYIDNLKKVILEKKKKFPIPVLDLSYDAGQEGLHRMMIAGDLFGWDTKFPVLLVETYDKARQERLDKAVAQREFTYKMDDILRGLKRYGYYDLEEFYEMLGEKIEEWFDQSPILSENGNELEVQIYSDEIDDSLIYDINLNEIEVEESNIENLDEVEEY